MAPDNKLIATIAAEPKREQQQRRIIFRKLRDCEDGTILIVIGVDKDGDYIVTDEQFRTYCDGLVFAEHVHNYNTEHIGCLCHLQPEPPIDCKGLDCYEWLPW